MQSKRYWIVFFLLGNHEPYHLTFSATKAKVRAFEERIERLRTMWLRAMSTIGRFIFLDQTRYDVTKHLTILGCTLFSHVAFGQADAVASQPVDFKDILNWTVHDAKRDFQSKKKKACSIGD
jgi:hypothetical protein